jgi:hypothetical protein
MPQSAWGLGSNYISLLETERNGKRSEHIFFDGNFLRLLWEDLVFHLDQMFYFPKQRLR